MLMKGNQLKSDPNIGVNSAWLQRSDSGSTEDQIARWIPDIDFMNPNVSWVAANSTKWAPGLYQQRMLMGGSFRAAERFSLLRFRNAVIQQ